MADNTGSGMTPLFALLLGGLLVAVVALGIFMYNGGGGSATPAARTVVVNVNHPAHHSWWPWHSDEHHDQRGPGDPH